VKKKPARTALRMTALGIVFRIMRLGAERGGALETNETEECKHQSQTKSTSCHAVKMELLRIQMPAVSYQQKDYDNHNHGDGRSLDP
jgi:hypothetical protein